MQNRAAETVDAARPSMPAFHCRNACARDVLDSIPCDLSCPGPAAATTNRTGLGSGCETCLRTFVQTSRRGRDVIRTLAHHHALGLMLLVQHEQRFIHATAFPRRDAPEVCISFARPNRTEGAGKAGCTLHPRSRVQCAQKCAHEHTGQRRHPGFPCAMVYGLYRALPGERAFLPPSLRENKSAQLDASVAASGPHDFAVRFHARSSLARYQRPPHLHRAFVTCATPLSPGETGQSCPDLLFGKSEIFFILGLDTSSENQNQ